MSREEVIGAIRERNPSADETFLAAFATPLLSEYLLRLRAMRDNAAGSARWVRATRERACVGMGL